MKPYYECPGVTLFLVDCRELLPMLPERSGIVITDPPFSAQAHAGAITNKASKRSASGRAGKIIDFAALSVEELAIAFDAMARVTSRWLLASVDWKHAAKLEEYPPAGMRFVRCGIWTKIAPMPQVTGDRPGQGWEAIAILHVKDEEMRWNGGARSGVWSLRAEMNGDYPTQKPEPLIASFVTLFSDPGETIIDPFCGSGTTPLVAMRLGRKAIACDISERALEIAAKRIEAEARQGTMFVPGMPKAKQAGMF